MPFIDVHNHYYPPAYLEALKRGPSNVRVTFDGEGNPLLHYPGDYNVVVRGHRDKSPSEYLRTMYYDTVNFDARALQLAIEFAASDHLLAGSDYPHQIGSLTSMLTSIQALPISEQDKAAILGGNASRLLRINV